MTTCVTDQSTCVTECVTDQSTEQGAPSWAESRKALAAAIERGAARRPQCYGTLFDEGGRSCALGALIEGLLGFIPAMADPEGIVHEHLGVNMEEIIVEMPLQVYGYGYWTSLNGAIMALNDVEHWRRERIANWLRGVENLR